MQRKMKRIISITRLLVITSIQLSVVLSVVLWVNGKALAQQSIEDNIRPVAQVCLAGQACVGTSANAAVATTSQQPAVIATETVVTETVVTESVVAAAAVAPATSAPEPEPSTTSAPTATPATEPAPVVVAFDAAATYQMSCFACHASGAAGAPKIGDAAAWSARMEKGMDAVMTNVTNGLNAMPAKGLCMNCSDDDLRALVDYMVNQ